MVKVCPLLLQVEHSIHDAGCIKEQCESWQEKGYCKLFHEAPVLTLVEMFPNGESGMIPTKGKAKPPVEPSKKNQSGRPRKVKSA